MTYEEIIETLQLSRCDSTVSTLNRAVGDETRTLVETTSKYRSAKGIRTPAHKDKAELDAREFYAEDITNWLKDPGPLLPQMILSHRRLATAWAVAEIIRDARNR